MSDQWKILTPITLGAKVCRNRVIMGAHSYGYVDSDGLPTHRLVDYLVERAKGGVGLIVAGGTSVSQQGALVERIALNVDDRIIDRYKNISDGVHAHGALILDQLAHVGGQVDPIEGHAIVAPSAIPHEICRGVPAELTLKEIIGIQEDFKQAAKRAFMGGLDGVEIKCDQGFLIHQFLSPYYNRRDDIYGGSLDNRIRFLKEILELVRAATDPGFIIGIRITGDSFTQGDITLDDSLSLVRQIESLSLIDFIHVNGGTNSTYAGYLLSHGDSSIRNMNLVPIARAIKQVTKLPVIASSMITRPEEAEEIIRSSAADMVAMTRPHIADAEIINKVRENRLDDIRPCIYCNQSCVGNHWKGADVRCIHNPSTGRERELGSGTIRRTNVPKSIMVIGGGVAGLEFSRVAAMRGHRIELYEETQELGGQVLLASTFPYRQGFLDIARYLEKQARKHGVSIYRGAKISAADVLTVEAEFDHIVMATGATPFIPPLWQLIDADKLLTSWELRREDISLGRNIIVVDLDWRQNALGVAELLLGRGCNIWIASTAFFVGEGLDSATLTSYYSRLEGRVKFLPLTSLESLKDQTARLRHVLSNRVIEIEPIDQVIIAGGARPRNDLSLELMQIAHKISPVGDCVRPMGVPEAILAATELARAI